MAKCATHALRKYWACYLFILPFFVIFFIFQFFPLVWSFVLSFQEWNGLGTPEYVGLQNYTSLFRDQMFLDAIANTAMYWIASVILVIPLSVVIAELFTHQGLKGLSVYKTIAFLPYITATVAIGLIFLILFDYNAGFVNQVLNLFGIGNVGWLISTRLSKIPVIVMNTWRVTPWFTMIVLSGLLRIPTELYEAARIDGASAIQRFFRITIPSIGGILFFCFVTISVDSWKIFTEPYILTRGGPGTSSISLFQYLYINGFTIFKLGKASAIGYVMTFILLLVSVAQMRIMKNRVGK